MTISAGKSYLLNELFYRNLLGTGVRSFNVIKFAFDSDEDIDLLDAYYPEEATKIHQKGGSFLVNAKKFRAYIKDKTNDADEFYIFLDEIQFLEGFVGTLNSLLRHKNWDIYVTGSNSRFLSSDIATEFNGRGSIVHVLPLSFSEYMEGFDGEKQAAWREYAETGGIPIVSLMKDKEEKVTYLKSLCEETYLKDIIMHNSVRKTSELSDTFDVIASCIGTLINPMKISNTFTSVLKKQISDDTVAKYIDYFENAFVISKSERYDIKGRKYIGSPYKLYFEDIGVRNARLNFRQIEEAHIMENVIYNELRYRGYNVDTGNVYANEKTDRTGASGQPIYAQKKLEVDFIATLGERKYYIQSALSMSEPEKISQEKKSLNCIDDSFKKIIVTKNGLNVSKDEKGIEIIDLFDFLDGEWG